MFQSPRQDLIESIKSSLATEYENNLRAERLKYEAKIDDLKKQHSATVSEVKAKEKGRDVAEQQVKFNEALQKALKAKDEEREKATREARSDLESKLEESQRKNEALEAELEKVRKLLEQNMTSSVMPANRSYESLRQGSSTDLRELERENKRLKDKLTSSMHALVKEAKVTVTGVGKDDLVLVVWAEEHGHYAVYVESPTLHFVHADSLKALGLNADGSGRKYLTAEVVSKEYCQARKPNNRFRVEVNTKFYRVKVRPVEAKRNGEEEATSNGDE